MSGRLVKKGLGCRNEKWLFMNKYINQINQLKENVAMNLKWIKKRNFYTIVFNEKSLLTWG